MLEEEMERYKVLKDELKNQQKAYRERTKPMRDELDLLKASITDAVLKAGRTIQIGDVKAEFVPTVVIKTKKIQEGE